MLSPFAHPVACCCVLLGVVAQSLHVAYGLNQIPFSEPLRGEHADECKCSCLNFPVKTNVLVIF